MQVLTITAVTAETTTPLIQMQIPDVDTMLAVPAILKALSELPRPLGQKRRKPRKDKGQSRKVVPMEVCSPEEAARGSDKFPA